MVSRERTLIALLAMILLSMPLMPMIVGKDLALRSLFVFLPLVASILVSLRSMRRGSTPYLQMDKVRLDSSLRFYSLVSFFIFLESASIAVRLLTVERSILYFFFQGLAVFVVSLQVVSFGSRSLDRSKVILIEMGVLLSLEILLKTLTFSYYQGNTDVEFHEQYAYNIMVNGHVGDFMGSYMYFPVLHITSAVLTLCVSTLTTARAIFVLFCVCGFVLPLILFSILHRTTNNLGFALTASFLGSFGSAIVAFLAEGMPQFLACILFLYLLMLILRVAGNMRFHLAGLVILITIIFTHQVSIPYFIAALVVFYLLYRHLYRIDSKAFRSGLHFIFLIAFSYVAYSVIQALSYYEYVLSLFSIPTGVDIPGPLELQGTGSYFDYFLLHIPWVVMILLAFLGILSFSGYSGVPRIYPRARPLIFAGLVSTFAVIPGFSSLSQFLRQYVAGGERFMVFPELVVACFMALFLLRSGAHSRHRTRCVIALTLSVVVLSAFIDDGNVQDTGGIGRINPIPRSYYDNRDISGLKYLESHAEIGGLSSDFRSSRFLEAHGVACHSPNTGTNGTVSFPGGSTVYLRSGDLASTGLIFQSEGVSAFQPAFTSLHPTSSIFFRGQNNVVFDSGTIQVVVCQKESWIGGG